MKPDRLGALLVGRWASGAPAAPGPEPAARSHVPRDEAGTLIRGRRTAKRPGAGTDAQRPRCSVPQTALRAP
jgi:hypothetical protein